MDYFLALQLHSHLLMIKRNASAIWKGNLKNGSGTLTTESNSLTDFPYSFKTRFEEQKGTNPEELVAAAHAGCFSMALSAELEKVNLTAEYIETDATVTLEKAPENGWSITEVHLSVSGQVNNADPIQLTAAA